MSTLFDVKGKIVLITGSSRGLGLILARGLGNEGAKVVLNGRDAGRLEEARRELEAEGGSRPLPAVSTSSDSVATNAAVAAIEKEIGPIDILVNNAGISV